jgi:hypothetical protein
LSDFQYNQKAEDIIVVVGSDRRRRKLERYVSQDLIRQGLVSQNEEFGLHPRSNGER